MNGILPNVVQVPWSCKWVSNACRPRGVRTVLLYLVISWLLELSASADDMSRADKIRELRSAASTARANHDRIQTWKGACDYGNDAKITGPYADSIIQQLPEADRSVTPPLLVRTKGTVRFAIDSKAQSLSARDLHDIINVVEDSTGKTLNPAGLLPSDESVLVTPQALWVFDSKKLERPTPGALSLFLPRLGKPTAVVYLKPRSAPAPPLWPTDANLWTTSVFNPETLFGHDRATWDLLEMYATNLEGPDAERVDPILQLRKDTIDSPAQTTVSLEAPGQHTEATFSTAAAGNLVRYVEFQVLGVSGQKSPLREITWTYKSVSGVFVPDNVTLKQFTLGSTEIDTERRFRLTDCEINTSLDASLFTVGSLPIEDGTRLRDETNQEMFFWKGAFLPLKELQAKLASSKSQPNRRGLILLVNALLVAAVIAIWLTRGRGERTQKPN